MISHDDSFLVVMVSGVQMLVHLYVALSLSHPQIYDNLFLFPLSESYAAFAFEQLFALPFWQRILRSPDSDESLP